MMRPAGLSDEESDYDGFSDHFEIDEYDHSDAESGYDEPQTTASQSLSESLENAMKTCLLPAVDELVQQIENYTTFLLNNNLKPLQFAAQLGKPELVEYFINMDVDYGVSNLESIPTPLTLACSIMNEGIDEDHLKCAELILDAGANINFQNIYGVNALMTACQSSTLEIVRFLLSRGANVNDRDNDGWSPIFYAVNRGEKEIVEELLKHEAPIDEMDKRNRYPYSISCEKGFTDVASLIKPKTIARIEKLSLEMETKTEMNILSKYSNETEPQYFSDVYQMLKGVAIGMERYIPVFRNKEINLKEFLLLKKEEDLKNIGVPFSWHRQTILLRIRQFHLGCWLPSSLGLRRREKEDDALQRTHIMQLLSYMATIRQQMYVLKASLLYLSDDVSRFLQPELVNSLRSIQSNLKTIILRLKHVQCLLYTVKRINQPYLLAQQI